MRFRGYSEDSRADIFRRIPNIDEIPLTSTVLIEASRIRERYGLTYFDPLHAASALIYDKKVISVDTAYQRVEDLELVDPRIVVEKHEKEGS